MARIAIINESSLAWEEIIYVIQQEFPGNQVTTYDISQQKQLLKEKHTFDLIIVDIGNKIFDFISTYRRWNTKIAAITPKFEAYVTKLFRLGLNGYLSTEIGIKELIYAIRKMLKGMPYISPSLSDILLEDYMRAVNGESNRPESLLTKREWEVLELIANGYSNHQIAQSLFISQKTVNNHVISILRKLNVPDRTNAAVLAVREKWIV